MALIISTHLSSFETVPCYEEKRCIRLILWESAFSVSDWPKRQNKRETFHV